MILLGAALLLLIGVAFRAAAAGVMALIAVVCLAGLAAGLCARRMARAVRRGTGR